MTNESKTERIFTGTSVSTGYADGTLRFLKRQILSNEHTSDAQTERVRLWDAISAVQKNLEALAHTTKETLGESSGEIFEIHAMLLSDEDFSQAAEEAIQAGKSASEAAKTAARKCADALAALSDPYLRARAADFEDLSRQIVGELSGEEANAALFGEGDPFLLVAEDLTPSETVRFNRSRILGFITFGGSPNSHTAILARAMGIPALIGVGQIPDLHDGAEALLDAAEGRLIISPDEGERELFRRARTSHENLLRVHNAVLEEIKKRPAVTQSGHHIMVYANVGDPEDATLAARNGADGVGLLRSEWLYLSMKQAPNEEILYQSYRNVAASMGDKRVVIRTLDIGADKQLPYLPMGHEENPALGMRGIRVTLANPALFKTQLRAVLRAGAHGRLALMLPMVVSQKEIECAKALLSECKKELEAEKLPYDGSMEFGIMIETPAAAVMAEELSGLVDFFSVGTNDLLQYTLAADRQNNQLEALCEENTEPVMKLIRMCADAIHKTGGWIGVCGELAHDKRLTQRFADMKIDELSVSPPYLVDLRERITQCI